MGDGILLWLYQYFCSHCFYSRDDIMAVALRVPEYKLKRALAMQGEDEVLSIFEPLMRFCLDNSISVDSILRTYKGGIDEEIATDE